jgi:hypothetical protein
MRRERLREKSLLRADSGPHASGFDFHHQQRHVIMLFRSGGECIGNEGNSVQNFYRRCIYGTTEIPGLAPIRSPGRERLREKSLLRADSCPFRF